MHRTIPIAFSSALSLLSVSRAYPQPTDISRPAKVKVINETLTKDANGGVSRTLHTEMQILNAAGVAALSQVPITYSSEIADIEITNAYTVKADGRKIPVATSAIFTRPLTGTANAPFFNDLMQKVIVFPNVEVGDSLVFNESDHQRQLLFPGQFMEAGVFATNLEYDAFTRSISLPSSQALNVDVKGVAFTKKTEADRTVYTFTYSNSKVIPDTNPQISTWDRMPRIYASSFHSYDELGGAYAAMVASKALVTPKIQGLADQLTDGITDRRDVAKSIYDYVSAKIRYVSISFGTGSIIPHDAETVLNNGYGDCKDKVMLLSALLKAKGIASEPVLVNATNGYTLSGPPTLAQLNHLIAWLPEFKLYVDATAQFGSFGVLPLEEYGKPVIHAVALGDVRRTIPIVQPGAMSVSHRTDESLDDTGKITGTTRVEATGPFDLRLRVTAIMLQATGGQRTIYPAIHPKFDFDNPERLDIPFRISGKFSTEANPGILKGDGFTPSAGTWLVARPGGVLMGLITQHEITPADDTPCYSGHEDEVITLAYPENRHVVSLPRDTEIKNEQLRYTTHWSVSGHTISVHRVFDTKVTQPLCTGKVRQDAFDALALIRQDYSTQVSLAMN